MIQVGCKVSTLLAVRKGLFSCEFLAGSRSFTCMAHSACLVHRHPGSARCAWPQQQDIYIFCMYVYMYVCMYVCMYVYVCMCVCMCMYVCMYTYVHVYMYTMYVCVYVYLYTYVWWWWVSINFLCVCCPYCRMRPGHYQRSLKYVHACVYMYMYW